MRKLFLTTIVAFATLFASAQFTVMSNVNQPDEGDEWSVESFTDNLGIGYQLTDDIMLGAVKSGENYDLFGRYNISGSFYLSLQVPTENSTDSLSVGAGYSFKVWNAFYVEPNYSMKKEGEGEFKIGIAYRF